MGSAGPGVRPDGIVIPRDVSTPAPACSNGIDDDCDGLIDSADPGCASPTDDDERGPGNICDDGLDNDNDGLRDYVVPGCGTVPGDPGCTSPTDMSEVNFP